jgi:lysophospholipase L1-like esterase
MTDAVVLTFGDSTVAGGWWQADMAELAEEVGVHLDMRKVGVGGVGWDYFAAPGRMKAMLDEHKPDLVIGACGTNNMALTAAEINKVGADFRTTMEEIARWWDKNRHTAPRIAPTLIAYSDPMIAPDWVLQSEPNVNDEIYRNVVNYYQPAGWIVGFVDWQGIPATADYLDAGGLHFTDLGNAAAAWFTWSRIHAAMSWPASIRPEPCGMYGHRKGWARPTYRVCPPPCGCAP